MKLEWIKIRAGERDGRASEVVRMIFVSFGISLSCLHVLHLRLFTTFLRFKLQSLFGRCCVFIFLTVVQLFYTHIVDVISIFSFFLLSLLFTHHHHHPHSITYRGRIKWTTQRGVCVLFAEWCSLRWNGFARKNSDKEMKNDQFCTHKTLVGFESVRFNENFSGLNYPPLSIQSSTVITIVDGLRTSEQDH